MKKLSVLCAMALATSFAHASEETARDIETYRFDFSCTYIALSEASTEDSPWIQADQITFRVDAHVFAEVTTDPVTIDSLQTSQDLNNSISISRNGNLIFADAAVLNSNAHGWVIAESNNNSPSVTVKHDNKPPVDLEANSTCYDSWLRFGDRKSIEGQCCVSALPF